jgi:hypothetical protein
MNCSGSGSRVTFEDASLRQRPISVWTEPNADLAGIWFPLGAWEEE